MLCPKPYEELVLRNEEPVGLNAEDPSEEPVFEIPCYLKQNTCFVSNDCFEKHISGLALRDFLLS